MTLDRNTKADSVETVNGRVRMDEQAEVRDNVTNVNGSIALAKGARIGGHIENVNGKIELDGATVGDGIKTTNGDIEIGAGSRVDGGIHVEKPDHVGFFRTSASPRSPSVRMRWSTARCSFDREVELRISDRATVGKIVGAQPIQESGASKTDVIDASVAQLAPDASRMHQIFQMRQRLANRQKQVHVLQLAAKHEGQHVHRDFWLGTQRRQFVELLQRDGR